MIEQRLIRIRARTVLAVMGLMLAAAVALIVVWLARTVLTWILVALFLTLAINPAVEWLQRRVHHGRGRAVAMIYIAVLFLIAGFAALVIPTLVDQVDQFVQAVPDYVRDLTHGRGPLGFLETKYHVVEKVEKAVGKNGGKIFAHAGVLLDLGKGIATAVAGIVTIIFLTLFMLLEGPTWMERFYGLVPETSRGRWENVGSQIYRTVGGYVTGNLAISVICGLTYGIVLFVLGVPYPVALGFIVAILDLVPLAGATIGGIIVVGAAFATSTTAAIVMGVVVVVYQQVENHLLQPVIYGRTVNLSPLAVLISVLIGAEVAGVLGALGAIPIAGAGQVLLTDALRHRAEKTSVPKAPGSGVAA